MKYLVLLFPVRKTIRSGVSSSIRTYEPDSVKFIYRLTAIINNENLKSDEKQMVL